MKVIQVFNRRDVWGGEDMMVDTITGVLRQQGHNVYMWTRENSEYIKGLTGKIKAFVWGIYSPSAYAEMMKIIDSEKPDVVHVHNLYPLFSPSVLIACRRAGVPVVVNCHSYYLTCPITFHFYDGKICMRCFGGREYWCILKNCRRNVFESAGYALRAFVARKMKFFTSNATLFVVLTEFSKRMLVDAGFKRERIIVVPNAVDSPDSNTGSSLGGYIAFVGRLSHEKGVKTLLSAAACLDELPVVVAGDGPLRSVLAETAPKNVEFAGWLDRDALRDFYSKARFLVVPSMCFESFGLIVAEAMSYGLPVIASNIGGLPELVEDGVTGILFEAGNSEDLADKMKLLWNKPELCRKMGQAGREKVKREYSRQVYYKRLMTTYNKAIEISKNGQLC